MPDLIAWFREQLDQDAAAAQAAVVCGPWIADDGCIRAAEAGELWHREGDFSTPLEVMAEHVARWDPTAVLADIAAKRAVLDLRDEWHENLRAWQVPEGQTRPEHLIAAQGWYQALTHAVALLAQGYAGRPGFDPSWRVT